jgi:hypothetical protein
MLLDLEQARGAVVEAASTREGEERLRQLSRQIQLDAWRRVAMGQTGRPGEWLDVLRAGLMAAAENPVATAVLEDLEQILGVAARAMPAPLPASERPRSELEQAIVDVLARSSHPLVRSEVHREVAARQSVSAPAVGKALERLATRQLVMRGRERRQGATEASIWQIAPAARTLAGAATEAAVVVPKRAENGPLPGARALRRDDGTFVGETRPFTAVRTLEMRRELGEIVSDGRRAKPGDKNLKRNKG